MKMKDKQLMAEIAEVYSAMHNTVTLTRGQARQRLWNLRTQLYTLWHRAGWAVTEAEALGVVS